MMLTPIAPISAVAFAAAGFAIAPVFPTGIAWLHERLHDATDATAIVIGASTLGGVGGPALVGLVISVRGPGAVPVVLFAMAICALAAALAVAAVGRSARTSLPT